MNSAVNLEYEMVHFQNETEQGIPGLEELPVIEVVDHHRIFRGERCDRRKGQRR
jgi:inorganic pyrophosphatase/exopolyphosphatase